MTSLEAVVDAAEFVLGELETTADVAYAEVGGVHRDGRDVVVRRPGSNSATSFDTTSVWWRVFVEGSAAYRHTSTLEEAHLEDLVERTVRSGRLLDQSAPARFDRWSVHRATHPGWGRGERLSELEPASVVNRLTQSLVGASGELEASLSRSRIAYTDEHERAVLLTTTGTAIHITTERARTESVLVAGQEKVQERAGSTAGRRFLDDIPRRTAAMASRLDRLARAPAGTFDEARCAVVLSPPAAASLFHQLSHYLEMDAVYLGASPFDVGDRLGPSGLTIEDVVRPECATARAFDAEGRPTQPSTLVDDGTVENRMHDVASAIEEGAHPSGNVIPSLGYDDPPRIHARHLDVAPGTASLDSLRRRADVLVERVGEPEFGNEATRTKRTSTIPPNTLYARDVAETTPAEFEGEADDQWLEFPVRAGYTLDNGNRERRIQDQTLVLRLADVAEIQAMSGTRATVAGTCSKHRSTLPWAATAPAVVLAGELRLG